MTEFLAHLIMVQSAAVSVQLYQLPNRLGCQSRTHSHSIDHPLQGSITSRSDRLRGQANQLLDVIFSRIHGGD